MNYLLSLAMFFPVLVGAATETRCGGGDSGPKPLSDISTTFQAEIKGVPTQGSVQEFLFSEKENALLYRNEDTNIFKTTLNGVSTKITESGKPLSRLTSDKERYFAAEAAPWVYDRKYQRWYSYKLDARPFRHLFFEGNALYSISANYDSMGYQTFSVYRYEIGTPAAVQICGSLSAPPGEHFTMAEGHSFPYAYLYRTFDTPQGKMISFFGINVGAKCDIHPFSDYTRNIAGPVKKAHVFPEIGKQTFAVEVDHPTHNFLWEHNGCRYFHTDGNPLVLNYRVPVIATWNDTKGLSLIYLDKESEAHLPPLPSSAGYGPRTLLPEDVWLANDARRLFLAPRFDWGPRWLLQMTLGEKI